MLFLFRYYNIIYKQIISDFCINKKGALLERLYYYLTKVLFILKESYLIISNSRVSV